MEVKVLGAAREVGRSAILIKGKKTNIILDYGVRTGREPAFPINVQPKDIDGVLITHAHLDHSGSTPMLYLSEGVDAYMTGVTADLSELLIEDLIGISGFYLPFEHRELREMLKRVKRLSLGDEIQIGEFKIKFHSAGHLPGATSFVIDDGKSRIMYTGDIDINDTTLLKGADTDYGDLDLVISESTYSQNEHPKRKDVEEDFVEFATQIVEEGGKLLVPAFAAGRAQEIACVLEKAGFRHPVAMDGLALKVNDVLMANQDFLKDSNLYTETIGNVELIRGWNQRRTVTKNPGVIISPAGMMAGGSVIFYNEKLALDAANGISLVAYQVPGTPGRTLIDKGLVMIHGKRVNVKAKVKRFDFSGHCGRGELFELFKRLKGSPKVLAVHGDEENCVKFSEEIKSKFGFDAVAPKAGESFVVN